MENCNSLLIDNALATINSYSFLPKSGSRIIVGLSGGVDSAVSAALLQKMGYEVIGLFMKNWQDTPHADDYHHINECSAEQDFHDVAITSKIIGVSYFSVNFIKEYKEEVFDEFIKGLKAGITPNPDILCNLEIKFKHLLNKALQLKAQALATGHYARCVETTTYEEHQNDVQKTYLLQRAHDISKDQTYFLYTASQTTLKHSVFPLAGFTKSHVRDIARALGLPVAEKKDSTGICFIGKRNFANFIAQYVGYNPGNMITPERKKVGVHQGLAYYTVGQRRGLNIGGAGDAWFVAEKRRDTNELVVVQGENHPYLFADYLYVDTIHWISGKEPTLPLQCSAKIRYRQPDQACLVEKDMAKMSYKISFSTPQRAITQQQSCVLYHNDICLGGGFITDRAKSYWELKLPLVLVT